MYLLYQLTPWHLFLNVRLQHARPCRLPWDSLLHALCPCLGRTALAISMTTYTIGATPPALPFVHVPPPMYIPLIFNTFQANGLFTVGWPLHRRLVSSPSAGLPRLNVAFSKASFCTGLVATTISSLARGRSFCHWIPLHHCQRNNNVMLKIKMTHR